MLLGSQVVREEQGGSGSREGSSPSLREAGEKEWIPRGQLPGVPATAGGSVLPRDQWRSKPQLFPSQETGRTGIPVNSGDSDGRAWSLRGREILVE